MFPFIIAEFTEKSKLLIFISSERVVVAPTNKTLPQLIPFDIIDEVIAPADNLKNVLPFTRVPCVYFNSGPA